MKTSSLRFEPINLRFNENLEPVEKNEDYYLLKEIFTSPEVMKTSTLFACQTPETERDLHITMYSMLEADEEFRQDYGMQKVFSERAGEAVGISGLIRKKQYAPGRFIAEGAIFLRPKFIGSGVGFYVEKCVFENMEQLHAIMIASAWEENKVAMKLMLKNNMQHVGELVKTHGVNNIKVLTFAKFPESLEAFERPKINMEELLMCSEFSKLLHT